MILSSASSVGVGDHRLDPCGWTRTVPASHLDGGIRQWLTAKPLESSDLSNCLGPQPSRAPWQLKIAPPAESGAPAVRPSGAARERTTRVSRGRCITAAPGSSADEWEEGWLVPNAGRPGGADVVGSDAPIISTAVRPASFSRVVIPVCSLRAGRQPSRADTTHTGADRGRGPRPYGHSQVLAHQLVL